MKYLLIALSVFAGLGLFLIVGYLFIKLKFKGMMKELANGFGALGMGGVPPFKLKLEEAKQVNWFNKEFHSLSDQLSQLSYEQLGDYRIEADMFDMNIRAFYEPSKSFFAVIYDSPSLPLSVDLVAGLENDEGFTFTSNKETGMTSPSFSHKKYFGLDLKTQPDLIADLHNGFIEALESEPTIAWSKENFVEIFEKAYKREMDWQIERGGPTVEEIVRISEISGQGKPNKDQIEMVQEIWKDAISDEIEERCSDVFIDTLDWTAEEKKWRRERLFFLHVASNVESIIGDFLSFAITEEMEDQDEDVYEKTESNWEKLCRGLSPKEAFEKLLPFLPDGKSPQFLGAMESPYTCDVYLMPEMDEDY